ncbi:MAG TPA: ATP-binding protein [Chthoniobacteraceae bacterium]|jgi:hypothetical protein|nr:ATP-binding protein [Chthoniobacteraceae bacterium]
MNRRISLSRIIAINWYGFRQIIDVEETILMSGVSGTGKSALLDLVQRVLLGEHWRSNRAAAGAMRGRSEVSYVLCDTNTTRNGEPHYTNRSRASYIALEFTWPAEKGEPRRETWGWRIQYDSPTSDPRRVYFCIPERAGWESFSKANELLDEDEFKTFIRREHGHDCLYSTQREYLAEMATPQHLYFNEEQLHKTMPKAIAFEPEENMEQFIREFILEESPIDVRDVRKSVIAYRETQERLLKQEDEAKFLRRVREFHTEYERERRTALLCAHLGAVLEEMRLRELLAQHRAKLEQLEASNASDNQAFAAKTEEAARLKAALEQFTLDADEAELQSKRSEQHGKLRERTLLQEAQQSVRDRLRTLGRRWREWLQRGAEQQLEGLAEVLTVEPAWLDALGAFDEAEGLQAIPLLAARFNELFHGIRQLLEPLEIDAKAAEAKLRTLASELERLEKGQTPGDFPLLLATRQALAKSTAVPEQLCRMIEVNPDAETDGWRRALELVLGRNRFAIVVESMDDYRVAMDLLRRQGRGDESIVHPREATELNAKPVPGSLAEKVTIGSGSEQQRKIAGAFVLHLVGRIIAAKTTDEMDRAPERAVMRDGTYKQKPIRRKLTQPEKLDFTLGLKRLRENLLREQRETTTLRDVALAQIGAVRGWVDLGKREWELGDARLQPGALSPARARGAIGHVEGAHRVPGNAGAGGAHPHAAGDARATRPGEYGHRQIEFRAGGLRASAQVARRVHREHGRAVASAGTGGRAQPRRPAGGCARGGNLRADRCVAGGIQDVGRAQERSRKARRESPRQCERSARPSQQGAPCDDRRRESRRPAAPSGVPPRLRSRRRGQRALGRAAAHARGVRA